MKNNIENVYDKIKTTLNEMAQIGKIRDKQNKSELFTVKVWTNDEGKIPHLHATNESKDVCVRLDCAEYFQHGNHMDTFNSEELQCFIKFLDEMDPDFNIDVYRVCVYEWNRNNSDVILEKDIERPDYTKLNG